jgi:hypothetical protein
MLRTSCRLAAASFTCARPKVDLFEHLAHLVCAREGTPLRSKVLLPLTLAVLNALPPVVEQSSF